MVYRDVLNVRVAVTLESLMCICIYMFSSEWVPSHEVLRKVQV